MSKNTSDKLPLKCPGKNHITRATTWYVPKGKTAAEETYCEYCYQEECVYTQDECTEYHSRSGPRVNCDCTKFTSHQKENPIVGLACSKCKKEVFFVAATIGACRRCRGYVHTIDLRYCAWCSTFNSKCGFCGVHIDEPAQNSDSSSESEDSFEFVGQLNYPPGDLKFDAQLNYSSSENID